MSVAAESFAFLSPEEYLEGEKSSEVRHEYSLGQVVAMSGASQQHETIALNLASAIRVHLKGSGCQVFLGGMKARIPIAKKGDKYYYPDLLVTCDPQDRQHDYFKLFPKLVVEVLSPTTEAFDRGDKFADYRRTDSLMEYVLVAQDRQGAEIFRRAENGRWEFEPIEPGGRLRFASIDFSIDLREIYEDVAFNPPGTPDTEMAPGQSA